MVAHSIGIIAIQAGVGRLVISTATAKAHVARLLAKLGARDRVQLVIAAYQAGLVFPSEGPPHEPRPDSRGK
jgi:hypothetical protein